MHPLQRTPAIPCSRHTAAQSSPCFAQLGFCFAVNAIAGVAFSDTLYPASDLYDSFLPNDWINILLGVPVVVLSAVLALRGRKLGAIGIGASLLFILYNAVAYLYALKNAFSLIVNALTVLLCAAGLILLMTSMRRRQPSPEPFPVRRPKLYGAILIVMGLIFIGRAAGNFVGAATGSANLPAPELGVNIADSVVCLFWIVSGALLFGKNQSGYSAALISYLHGSLLFLALILLMVLQPVFWGIELVLTDLLVIAVMSLTFFVPCALLTRGFLSAAKGR